MPFVIICTDKSGQGSLRADNRSAHLDYLETHRDRILMAGPLLGEDGQSPVGSLLIMDFDQVTQARDFATGDPYAKAGLFDRVEIKAWRKVLP